MNEAARLTVGRLGAFSFVPGTYGYVGSARGPGGLAGRLKHHLMPARKLHWHVDYLRIVTDLETVWWWAGDERFEHRWAGALAQLPGAELAAPRFGASDCRCPGHLYVFPQIPEVADFAAFAGVRPMVT